MRHEHMADNVVQMKAPPTTKLADIEAPAAQKPDHTAKEEREGVVVLRTRLERPIFFFGLVAPAILLVVLWIAGVF